MTTNQLWYQLTFEEIALHPDIPVGEKDWLIKTYHPDKYKEWLAYTKKMGIEVPQLPAMTTPSAMLKKEWQTATTTHEEPTPEAPELDPYAIDREQMEARRWEFQQDLALRQQEAQRQAEYQQWQMAQPSDVELRQRLWEQQQEAELAGMTAPSDWITRWMMTAGLQQQRDTRRLEGQVESRGEASDIAWSNYARTRQQVEGDEDWQQTPRVAQRTIAEKESKYWSLRAKELEAQEELELVTGTPIGTPEAPEWLSKFVPGQTAGQPISKGRTTTPSGQQWTQTPWSQREGLRGYTEWAGYRPFQDILEQMAMMAPRTPTGAGRTQWKPATQRA